MWMVLKLLSKVNNFMDLAFIFWHFCLTFSLAQCKDLEVGFFYFPPFEAKTPLSFLFSTSLAPSLCVVYCSVNTVMKWPRPGQALQFGGSQDNGKGG